MIKKTLYISSKANLRIFNENDTNGALVVELWCNFNSASSFSSIQHVGLVAYWSALKVSTGNRQEWTIEDADWYCQISPDNVFKAIGRMTSRAINQPTLVGCRQTFHERIEAAQQKMCPKRALHRIYNIQKKNVWKRSISCLQC